jgi:hypothetical protein
MHNYDMEEKLINFSVAIIALATQLNQTKAGDHLGEQIMRSATAATLGYSDAQSNPPALLPLRRVVKELRATMIALKIIQKSKLMAAEQSLWLALKQNDALLATFTKKLTALQQNGQRYDNGRQYELTSTK